MKDALAAFGLSLMLCAGSLVTVLAFVGISIFLFSGTPALASHVCLPPGVEDNEVFKDITGQTPGITPFGPGHLLDFRFHNQRAEAVIVEGPDGKPELVYLDPAADHETVPVWVRDDLNVCEWRLLGGTRQGV